MTTVIDIDEAMERVEGDRELLTELAQLFLGQIPQLVADMHRALTDGDAATLRRAAHSLKGSAGNVAALAVYETAAQLERLAKDGQLTESFAVLARLEPELAKLTTALFQLSAEHLTQSAAPDAISIC